MIDVIKSIQRTKQQQNFLNKAQLMQFSIIGINVKKTVVYLQLMTAI